MNLANSLFDSAYEGEELKQLNKLLNELPEQYEVLDRINEGGMGAIFKARNRYTSANVAIKLMHFTTAVNADAIKRFYFEAKAASLLKHVNICRVLDFGVTQGGSPYLVMDWVEGESLNQVILGDEKISTDNAILIFKQIAMALEHAHQRQIIHRDLKPENIMLSKNQHDDVWEVQLVDFGVAKIIENAGAVIEPSNLTKVGLTIGTPKYMSPEQALGHKLDHRSDIYSLGCVMYFVLTGHPPFKGKTSLETLQKHVYEATPQFADQLKIPTKIQNIIFKTMEKNPNDRFENANTLIYELDKIIAPEKSAVEANQILAEILPELIIQNQQKQFLRVEKTTAELIANKTIKIPLIVWFLLGFCVIYGLSLILQERGDDSQKLIRSTSNRVDLIKLK
jgi:serine/threonine protein kinase